MLIVMISKLYLTIYNLELFSIVYTTVYFNAIVPCFVSSITKILSNSKTLLAISKTISNIKIINGCQCTSIKHYQKSIMPMPDYRVSFLNLITIGIVWCYVVIM